MSSPKPTFEEVIAMIFADWMYDDAARVGPTRVLVGNNFDLLQSQVIEACEAECRKREQEASRFGYDLGYTVSGRLTEKEVARLTYKQYVATRDVKLEGIFEETKR